MQQNPQRARTEKQRLALGLLLAIMSFSLYAPTVRNGFIYIDDSLFIAENPLIRQGLTWETISWSLRTMELANWYPLTRLSHLLDVNLFGMWAGGHHLVSAAWHAAAAASLFAALHTMTGALWRSAAVAILFAVHPAQVESVAWATERSMVLAGFFFWLTLALWARYVRRPGAGRYCAALLCFALGLASKPVVVTVPVLLLFLDFWPLGRARTVAGRAPRTSFGFLLLEKVPFAGLAALVSLWAVFTQGQAGTVKSLLKLSFEVRIANAALSYWRYLGTLFWPADLAVYYPHPSREISLGLAAVAGLALVALTLLLLRLSRRRPWLGVGWCWYVAALLPMIGIIQVGSQARADRYLYLPSVGVFLLVVWFAAEDLPLPRRRSSALVIATFATVAALGAVTVVSASRWRDSLSLVSYGLTVTRDNWFLEFNLGIALEELGRREEALAHYRQTLRLRPNFGQARNKLGKALLVRGNLDEALQQLQMAAALTPDNADARNNLGILLRRLGRPEEAIAHFREVARLEPEQFQAYANLGNTLRDLGRREEAATQYLEALRIQPDEPEIHANLGYLLFSLGRNEEATLHVRESARLRSRPGKPGGREPVPGLNR